MRDLRAALFFLSEAEDGADYVEAYLKWHMMEHMPEQFLGKNIFWGQRFVATPGCIEASAVRSSAVGNAQHLQNYLFEDPGMAWKEINDIGYTLRGRGLDRPRAAPEMRIFGVVNLARTYAAPRTMLSHEVIAMRPNHGIYLIVESEPDSLEVDSWALEQHLNAEALLHLPSAAGIRSYSSHYIGRGEGEPAQYLPGPQCRITVVYLDGDPIRFAQDVRPHLERRWKDCPATPLLAGPFRSLFPPPERLMPSD